MSALNKPESVRDSASEASASEDGMTSGKSPQAKVVRVGMKRSGTLPSFPSTENLKEKARPREVELPVSSYGLLIFVRIIANEQNDPKTWTGMLFAV
jgi:hypothetical protein